MAQSCLATHDLSSLGRRRPPLKPKKNRNEHSVVTSYPELHSSQAFGSTLPEGGQTAHMKPPVVEASHIGRQTDLSLKSSSDIMRSHHRPRYVRPSEARAQPSSYPRIETCAVSSDTGQGSAVPKNWPGLGQTQAALAQLEWENRKLMHEASRQRARAAKAEVRAAELTVMEEKCVKLTLENKRLLNRLLRFVSPAEAERTNPDSSATDLAQKLSVVAEENKLLIEQNKYLMRKNFESLQACQV